MIPLQLVVVLFECVRERDLGEDALTRLFGVVKRSRNTSRSPPPTKSNRKPEKARETVGNLMADIGDEMLGI